MHEEALSFELCDRSSHKPPQSSSAKISVAASVIEALYHATVNQCVAHVHMPGFQAGAAPYEYVARNYHATIVEHIRNFLITFSVETFLKEQLRRQRIILLGIPKCLDAFIELHKSAHFVFEINVATIPINQSWKYLHFRPPTRKNYRDLDNQVATFLSEEAAYSKKMASTGISHLDWINFTILPCSVLEQLPKTKPSLVWMRVGNEDPDQEAQDLFLHKLTDSRLTTEAHFLQDYFCSMHDNQYKFDLQIMHHTPHATFSIDSFKQHFKLKSDKELHRKLIEVFSFRHDISQRRETAEAVLKMLLKLHPFHIPPYLLHHETTILLDIICRNPDYYVYKAQADFQEKVQMLATKRLKEAALMDALASAENLTVTHHDILDYMNLLKRPRTKEFVYFLLPETKIQERETPLPHEMVYQSCLREKTLNYAIHTLTRSFA